MGDPRILVVIDDDLRALDRLRDLSDGALSREDVLSVLHDFQEPGEPLILAGGRIPDHIDLYPSLPERRSMPREEALAAFAATEADRAQSAAADAKRARKNAKRSLSPAPVGAGRS